MVQLCDTLDATTTARICADGSLVADVRAARIGIQTYLASEAGAPADFKDNIVRVFRPEEEVFNRDSMASFAAAPFTIDHPTVDVNADNWRQLGVGEVNGDVVRDGGFVRVPVKDMADAAIEGAFLAFTKDAKPNDPLRETLKDGVKTVGDAAAREQQAFDAANDFNAWRKQA